MKIEIAVPGRMTQSGSSLLKLIQNNNMPVLDLLVRESVQNSLDAKDNKEPYVTVEFIVGEFRKGLLNNELEGITCALNKRYCNDTYRYIAIKDSNTVGLTGKLYHDEVTDNQYGNLLKLVYEISKPQEAEGAGGSWGLGKTVYFRVGMGLVFYYSRIINEQGKYESRLAATLVENELDTDSLIPVLDGKTKRGIAWWGENKGYNETIPITDEEYIHKIINIFGFAPYTDLSTGTTIIIPYIDEENLLTNNQAEYKDGENKVIQPYWRNDIEDYIRIAVQRWYAPRLNNIYYPYGNFLRAKINGKDITSDVMEPIFQVVQTLYNHAISKTVLQDILQDATVITKVDDIGLRNVLETTKAGTIAYTKVSRQILRMSFPDNKPEPYIYTNCELRDTESNKPIIFFTRSPGMIVSYESMGRWVDGIGSTSKEDFILAIFVLNSNNKLLGTSINYSLEEYVRKSEMADHTSWSDFSIGNYSPRIITRIQGQVIKKLSNEFSVGEDENISKLKSGLGKMFGDLLLPPENFGKMPSSGQRNSPSGKIRFEKHKNVILGCDTSKTKYTSSGMIIELYIKSKGFIKRTGIKLAVDSDSGAISIWDWENRMGLAMPFEIMNYDINVIKLDGKPSELTCHVDYSKQKSKANDILSKMMMTESGKGYGILILMDKEHSLDLKLSIRLKLHRKDIKPLFALDKVEGDD